MTLDIDDLYNRHSFWKDEIGKAGIWDPGLFLPVTILIRKRHRRYNALFQRRWIRGAKDKTISDKIIVYRNGDDFEDVFIDSMLVHEMIHQYIIQNNIKDTSVHGKAFKEFMGRINNEFKNRLQINLKDHNPRVPLKGEGETVHILLILKTATHFFCCVVHPSKAGFFERIIRRNKSRWAVKSHMWAKSFDRHFNNYTRCMKTIHGIKKPLADLDSFILEFGITEL